LLATSGTALALALTLPSLSSTRIQTWPWATAAAAFWALPLLLALARLARRSPDSRLGGLLDFAFAGLALAGLLATALSPLRATLAPQLLPFLGALALPYALLPLFRDARRSDLLAALFIYPTLAASALHWLADGFSGRNTHPFGHANTTGSVCALAACWLAGLATRSSSRAARWVHGLSAAAAAALAASSSSRGAVLALALAAIFAAGSLLLRRGRVITFLALTFAALGVAITTNHRLRDFAFGGGWSAAASESNAQRAAMFQGGLALAAERPLTGWGPGAVPHTFPRVRADLPGTPDNYLHLHNALAQTAATTGALGLASLALLLAALLRAVRPLLKNPADTPLLATLLCGGVILLFDHPFATPAFALLAALPLATLATKSTPRATPSSSASVIGHWSFVIPALAALALALAPPVGRDLAARAAWDTALDHAGADKAAAYAASLRRAHDLAPADPFYADQLAAHLFSGHPFSWLQAPDPAAAVELLRETLARNPAHEFARYNLGWLLLQSDPAAARDHFVAALRLAPRRSGAYLGLALARIHGGDTESPLGPLAAEILLDPAFAWSPRWHEPALAPHRPAALAHAADFLVAHDLAPLFATWLRHAGPPAKPLAFHRRVRTGHGVLYGHPEGPPPVDLPLFPRIELLPRVKESLPPRGFLPPALLRDCAKLSP
jgi:O-antigen ligase